MENNEKRNAEEIKLGIKVPAWLDNFWYHYKWHTIIALFALIVLLVGTLQMCSREKEDINILYAGPLFITDSMQSELEAALEAGAVSDFDGNGETNAVLSSYLIYTKEQIEAIEAETDENGYPIKVDRAYVTQNNENFYDHIMTGECSVCLLDPSLYESLLESDRLAEIGEGVYGVALRDTALYESFAVLRTLPEETVVCLLRKNFLVSDEVYANDRATFEAIVGISK